MLLNREALLHTVDLFNEVSKHEHMVNKKSFWSKGKSRNIRSNDKSEEKNPCKICKKLNKGDRYHPEALCWFRTKEEEKVGKNIIKHVNNSAIETELNEHDQKNEQ